MDRSPGIVGFVSRESDEVAGFARRESPLRI